MKTVMSNVMICHCHWGVSSVPFPFRFPFQLHCELVSSLLAQDTTELVSQPLTQMVTSESKKPRQIAVVITTAICLGFFDSDVISNIIQVGDKRCQPSAFICNLLNQ